MNFKFVNEKDLDYTLAENSKLMLEAFKEVEREKGLACPNVINGERKLSKERNPSINPADKNEILGTASLATVEDVDSAINAAHSAFQSWRYTSVEERVKLANKVVELLRAKKFYLNAWIVQESGKNWAEAEGEISETIDFFNSYSMEMINLSKGLDLEKTSEKLYCNYIPIGVGVAISPWNFPLALMAGMIASALITGNTVVIKPADSTPIIAYKFFEILEEAGYPKGVINFVSGKGSVIGDRLVEHPKTRFINFTGSRDVGVRISALAGKLSKGQIWLKRIVAEMGGKNAIIIDSSADIKSAASGVVASAFSFQGQKCSACSRVLVMADVYDNFISELTKAVNGLKKGSGRDNASFGPVISQKAYKGIVDYLEIGRKEGKVVCGGTYDDSIGYFIDPTVIIDIDRKDRIANEEIFGPVLAVLKVNSFDEAIEIANSTEYALTGAVYSNEENNLEKARKKFYVGNLYFNRKSTGAVVRQHPFGGYNMSGTAAKTGTKDYLLNFLQLKSIAEKIS